MNGGTGIVLFLLVGVSAISGCRTSHTTVECTHRAANGEMEEKVYSGYYEGLYLIVSEPRGIGLHLRMQMQNRKEPVTFRLRQFFGMLTPDERYAQGVFSCVLVNISPTEPMAVRLDSVKHGDAELLSRPTEVALSAMGPPTGAEIGDAGRVLELGSDKIDAYGKEEKVAVTWTFRGAASTKSMVLDRLTYGEIEKRYGYRRAAGRKSEAAH